MNTPPSIYTGLLVRSFRYLTKQIAHPVFAWFLLLVLVSSNLVYGWVAEKSLNLGIDSLVQRAEFDRRIIDAQDEILNELRKATPDNCQ